jgi:hypothetical protein
MIGSTDFSRSFVGTLGGAVELWEDGLTTNSDEFVYVDGEEGDYGIIKYLDKNNVVVMVKYVKGGDVECSTYTAEGLAVVRELLMQNFEECLDMTLSDALDPPEGMFGFKMGTDPIQARRDQDAKTLRKLRTELHQMRAQNRNV